MASLGERSEILPSVWKAAVVWSFLMSISHSVACFGCWRFILAGFVTGLKSLQLETFKYFS